VPAVCQAWRTCYVQARPDPPSLPDVDHSSMDQRRALPSPLVRQSTFEFSRLYRAHISPSSDRNPEPPQLGLDLQLQDAFLRTAGRQDVQRIVVRLPRGDLSKSPKAARRDRCALASGSGSWAGCTDPTWTGIVAGLRPAADVRRDRRADRAEDEGRARGGSTYRQS
jgi:hypothetical protein